MATFTAACYDDKGSVTMSEAAKLQLMADKTSMTETVATRDATIVGLNADMTSLLTAKEALEASKSNSSCGSTNGGKPCQCVGRRGSRNLLFASIPSNICTCA